MFLSSIQYKIIICLDKAVCYIYWVEICINFLCNPIWKYNYYGSSRVSEDVRQTQAHIRLKQRIKIGFAYACLRVKDLKFRFISHSIIITKLKSSRKRLEAFSFYHFPILAKIKSLALKRVCVSKEVSI